MNLNKKNKIFFKLLFGPEIGLGHLSRCSVLAKEFKNEGYECILISNNQILPCNYQNIFKQNIVISENLEEPQKKTYLFNIIKKSKPKVLIIDEYKFPLETQIKIKKIGVKILHFVLNEHKKSLADIIVANNPSLISKNFLKKQFPNAKEFLVGTKYCLIKESLRNFDKKSINFPIKNIFISFGGGNDKGLIKKFLYNLREYSSINFFIASTSNNSLNMINLDWIKKNKYKNVKYFIDFPDLGELIFMSDLAIISGGILTFELAYFGIPMIIVSLAENQVSQSEAWQSMGAAIYLGKQSILKPEIIKRNFFNLIKDKNRLIKMQNLGLANVDALGSKRIIDSIKSLV